MQPRTTEVLAFLQSSRTALEDAVASVRAEAFLRRPPDGGWSAGEVVAHLAIVEQRIVARIVSLVSDARAAGLGAESDHSPVADSMPLDRLVDREQRIKNPPATDPPASIDRDSSWTTLRRAREQLVNTLVSADGLALSTVLAPHLLLGTINVYQWAMFLGAHESRHAAQIRDVAAAIGKG